MKIPFYLLALVLPLCAAEKPHDIVVYGGTSGGIISAIQAAKSKHSVVLVSPTSYLGGLTTSALGLTDLGSDKILGGLSRDFYTRVYQHYQKPDAWKWEEREKFGNEGQGVPALNPKTKLASVFEPSVTTAIFNDMLKEHRVKVVTARLDLKNGVIMDGKRIQKIRTEDGREFAGKMFIDASYEIYVREARRMVSDFVMTEHHCRLKQPVSDPIGLGAYAMDSHQVQRHVKGGMLKNEGDVQFRTGGIYGISYRSIVPKNGECENLLVPWCLSASHMAFGSIRMEPVFMILSQSATTAAALAIEEGISVQQVPYEKLKDQLEGAGQVLNIPDSSRPRRP